LLSSSGRGGREINTVRLIPYLRKEGLGVEVAILDADGYVSDWCRAHGVPCYLFGRFLPAAAVCLFRLLRKLRPDLVHVYGFYAGMAARFIARLTGTKMVVGIVGAGHFGRWRSRLERWTAFLADFYVANSHEGRKRLLELIGERHSERVAVVQNGVPPYGEIALSDFHPKRHDEERSNEAILPPVEIASPAARDDGEAARDVFGVEGEGGVVLGSLGSLRPEKGYDTILAALRKMVEDFKDPFVYLVAGEGKLRPALERQADAPGLEGKVKFLGLIEDTRAFLHRLDLFVLPSYSEGLPNALLEAMAAGRCVVATRVGGVPEIVEHGVHGILVEAGDAAGLASAVVELLRAPEHRRLLGEKARERVQAAFTLERQAVETVRIYRTVTF